MSIRKKTPLSLVIALVLLATSTTFLSAQTPAGTPTPSAALPPLPEWPVIGPILRLLGVAETVAPEVRPSLDPDLTEYRIATWDDIDQLQNVENNERIRIIATDTDLNQIARDLVSEAGYDEDAGLRVAFNDPIVAADAHANAVIIKGAGIDIPAWLRRNLKASATFTVEASNCSVSVTFDKIKVNGWSFGLRSAANRLVNEQIARFWPEELCAETVIVMDGEAAIEGYLNR